MVASLAAGVASGACLPSDHIALSASIMATAACITYILIRSASIPWYMAALFLTGLCRGLAWKVGGGAEFQEWEFATRSRMLLIQAIEDTGFGPVAEPIIKALISGDRSDVAPAVRDAFRSSGASHLLALSGMHLGIIYAMISRVLGLAGGHPVVVRIRSAMIISACLFYAIITGASPSIMRAFLFILLRETALVTGRSTDPAGIFSTALMLHLLFSPGSIMTPGFQLSYLAMAGIYLLFPKLKAIYPENRHDPIKKIWDIASLSISCQTFTAPVAWYHFHSFPRWFLLTNMIAMPLASLLIPLAILAIILHSIGLGTGMLTWGVDHLAGALTSALGIIASM